MNKIKKGPLIALSAVGVAGIGLATTAIAIQQVNKNGSSQSNPNDAILKQIEEVFERINVEESTKLSIVDDAKELPEHTDTLRNGVLSFIVPESNENNNNYLDGVKLTYSHGEIKHDGQMDVIVTAEKEEVKFVSVFQINIVDLDNSIIDEVKNSLQNSKYSYSSKETTISAANNAEAINGEYLGIKLPENLYDSQVTFSHPEITSDGTYDVTVNITSGKSVASTTVQLDVTGIDEKRAESVRKYIEAIGDVSYPVPRNTTSIPSVPKGTEFNVNASYLNIDLTQIDKMGSLITFSNQELTSDGGLVVDFEITVGNVIKHQSVNVNVSGMSNEIDYKIISDIADELDGKNFKYTTQLTSINSISDEERGLEYLGINLNSLQSLHDGVTFRYSHGLIDKDGFFDVKIDILKGSQSRTQIVRVDVNGIDAARVEAVRKSIESIQQVNYDSSMASISKVENGTSFELSKEYLGINLSKIDTMETTITIGHDSLIGDGTLDVEFTISRGNIIDTQIVKVNVNVIDQPPIVSPGPSQSDRDIVEKIASEISYRFIHQTNLVTIDEATNEAKTGNYLGIDLSKITTDQTGVTYEYSNEELTVDGELEVNIKIMKGDQFTFKTVKVFVTGINEARVKSVIDQLASISPTTYTVTDLDDPMLGQIYPPVVLDTTKSHLGIDIPSIDFLGTNVLFKHSSQAGSSIDGVINVTFYVSRGTANANQVVTVKLDGLEEAREDYLFGNLPRFLSLNSFDFRTNALSIDAIQNDPRPGAYLGIDLSNSGIDTTDLTFEYTHPEITGDGEVEVTVKIIKGDRSITAKTMVNVIGIDDARVWATVTAISKIGRTSYTSPVATIDEVKPGTEWTTNPYLGINLSGVLAIANTLGTKVTFEHQALTGDGTFEIKFTVSKEDKVNYWSLRVDVKTDLTSINQSSDRAIVNKIASELEGKSFSYVTNLLSIDSATSEAKTTPYLGIDLSTITADQTGVTYEYTNETLTTDDQIEVTIKIMKGDIFTTQKVLVDVRGIDEARVQAVKSSIGNINNNQPISYTSPVATIDEVKPGTQWNTNPYLGIDLSSIDLLETDVKFEHLALTGNGTLDVVFKISKGNYSETQVVKVNVTTDSTNTQTNDKTIVNQIASELARQSFDYETNLISIPAATNEAKTGNYLGIDLSKITTDQTGVTYEYTNSELTADGQLEVTVKIMKGTEFTTQKVMIDVTGIDSARVEKVQVAIARLNNGLFSYTSPVATIDEVKPGTQWNVNPHLGIDLSSIDLLGTEITFEHLALTGDGILDVKFKISKGNNNFETQVVRVNVTTDSTNTQTNDKTIVNQIASELARQSFDYETNLISIPAATNEAKTGNYLGIDLSKITTDQTGVTYEYTNSELTADGQLEVTVKIMKGTEFTTQKVMIDVTGIDSARVEKVQVAIARLNNGLFSYTSPVATIDEVKPGTQWNVNPHLGIDLSSIDLLGTEITFEHLALTGDGILDVKFKISKGNNNFETQVVRVNVTTDSTNTQTNDKTIVNQIASELARQSFDYETNLISIPAATNEAKTGNYLGIDLSKITTDQTGVTYEYTNSELTADGQLEVTVKIMKGTEFTTQKVMIDVTGIDSARVEKVQVAIARLNNGLFSYTSKVPTIEQVNAGTQWNVNPHLGIDLSSIDLLGTEITFEHLALTGDGTLDVKFTISKGVEFELQNVRVSVTAIDSTINGDTTVINKIADELSKLQFSHWTNLISIPAATNEAKTGNYLGIDLSKITTDQTGVTYEYTNSEFTFDGKQKVTVKISKDGQSVNQDVFVDINGIDAARLSSVRDSIVEYINNSGQIRFESTGNITSTGSYPATWYSQFKPLYGIDLTSIDTLGATIQYSHGPVGQIAPGQEVPLNINITITKFTGIAPQKFVLQVMLYNPAK